MSQEKLKSVDTQDYKKMEFEQIVELSPINTMTATIDGTLTFLNKVSIETLKTLQGHISVPVDQLVGQSIDMFHKNPAVQRKIIGDPKNLPYQTIIDFAGEKLDLLLSPLYNSNGEYEGPLVSWSVVTESLRDSESAAMSDQMIDLAPINILMCSVDGTIEKVNKKSVKTLNTLRDLLPCPPEDMVGKKMDIFHKTPSFQQNIIGDPNNLPHKATITLGTEKLELEISPVFNKDNEYMGPMVTWDLVTSKYTLVSNLKTNSEQLEGSSTRLMEISSSLSSAAEETSAQANTASVAGEEVNAGVQSVASNMDEMSEAIKEITKVTSESSQMSSNASKLASKANDVISQLDKSSIDIGDIIKVISSIAQQTNLLALNATIEAARAGEAGKGFAVVANEVKELAKQTAKATSDITQKIEAIQNDSKEAMGAIVEIGGAIDNINGHAANIASSVEEQAATTNEVSRIVVESAEGVKQISENIGQVSQAATMTGKDAINALEASKDLKGIVESLNALIKEIDA